MQLEVSGLTTSDLAFDALDYYNDKNSFRALVDLSRCWADDLTRLESVAEYKTRFEAAINLVRTPVTRTRNMLLAFFAFQEYDFFDTLFPDYKIKGALDRLWVLVRRMLKEKQSQWSLEQKDIKKLLRGLVLKEVVGEGMTLQAHIPLTEQEAPATD